MNEVIPVLQNWTDYQIVGVALMVGFVLKNYIDMDNKHIPLIMLIVGVLSSYGLGGWQGFEQTVIRGGMSGLVSTGLHQVFHQYVKGDGQIHEIPNENFMKGE